jgi:DNA-nicking Smr family endonuclease
MSRRRSLSEEERALWTGVVRSIKPLHPRRPFAESPKPNQPVEDSGKHPAKTKKSAPAGARAPMARGPEPETKTPPLAPLGRRLKQRVARGREPIEARLDLHGFTQAEAHAALLRFLRRAQTDGVRMALIVTGKGTRKAAEMHERGVLKRQVPLWLSLPEFRALVVGYEDAHVAHGGTGALYVRLRRAAHASD